MQWIVSPLLLFFMPLFADAGEVTGNGGDAVICKDAKGNVQSVELLDFHEARLRSWQIDLKGSSVRENLELIYQRIQKVDPEFARPFGKAYEDFFTQADIAPHNLTNIKDSHTVVVPAGCTIQQVAIRVDEDFGTEKRYFVDSRIYNSMSPVHQAGLVFHELMYGRSYDLGHKNSVVSRKFVAWVASSEFSRVDEKRFAEFLRKNRISSSSVSLNDEPVKIHSVVRQPNGNISEVKIVDQSQGFTSVFVSRQRKPRLNIKYGLLEVDTKRFQWGPDGFQHRAIDIEYESIVPNHQTLFFRGTLGVNQEGSSSPYLGVGGGYRYYFEGPVTETSRSSFFEHSIGLTASLAQVSIAWAGPVLSAVSTVAEAGVEYGASLRVSRRWAIQLQLGIAKGVQLSSGVDLENLSTSRMMVGGSYLF